MKKLKSWDEEQRKGKIRRKEGKEKTLEMKESNKSCRNQITPNTVTFKHTVLKIEKMTVYIPGNIIYQIICFLIYSKEGPVFGLGIPNQNQQLL